MTIKEIEELAGMPRANIRYYEAEGLLSPTRSENGYRDYSGGDLLILKKIKLLRSLHMSMEEIKALHTGKQELSAALEQQIQKLSAEKENLGRAQIVCESMYKDGIKYESFEAEKYLLELSGVPSVSANKYWDTKEAKEDTIPRVQAPWRRYFARMLDWAVYSMLWSCFLIFVFHVNMANQGFGLKLAEFIATLILTIVLEPLQLSLFGTTLGKWILGLRVLHNDDRKLSFSEGYDRTKVLLFYGLGCYIPILSLFFLWKSYKSCTHGESLEWEYESRIVLKDEKKYRIAVYIAVRALLFGLLLLANVLAQMPMHRGELTVAEFCENYRQLEKYYGITSTHTLDNNGVWQDNTPDDGTVVINPFPVQAPPVFQFETDSEGNIQKISFVVETFIPEGTPKEEREAISNCQLQMQLAALAYVGAQDTFSQFSSAREKMLQIIVAHEFEDYDFTEAGVKVTCDVQWQGYELTGSGTLVSWEEEQASFFMEFMMSTQN